jgi:5-methyltetrahydropteroyltriglutamate--homocysteine methyltransferase
VTLINAQQAAAYYDATSRGARIRRSTRIWPTSSTSCARRVDELVRLGCTYIQLDAPQYAGLIDPAIRDGYRARGSDPDRLLERCIELDNAVIGDHPESPSASICVAGTIRACSTRAAATSPWHRCSSAPGSIASSSSTTTRARGGFEPLRHVPEDRTVVLGLVTTKKPALEAATRSSVASTRRRDSCRSSASRSARMRLRVHGSGQRLSESDQGAEAQARRGRRRSPSGATS